jgi:hypothetical protein
MVTAGYDSSIHFINFTSASALALDGDVLNDSALY